MLGLLAVLRDELLAPPVVIFQRNEEQNITCIDFWRERVKIMPLSQLAQ